MSLINSLLLNIPEFVDDRTNIMINDVHKISLWETQGLVFPIIFQVYSLALEYNFEKSSGS